MIPIREYLAVKVVTLLRSCYTWLMRLFYCCNNLLGNDLRFPPITINNQVLYSLWLNLLLVYCSLKHLLELHNSFLQVPLPHSSCRGYRQIHPPKITGVSTDDSQLWHQTGSKFWQVQFSFLICLLKLLIKNNIKHIKSILKIKLFYNYLNNFPLIVNFSY